jgi:lipopolysaccharide export system permease protein
MPLFVLVAVTVAIVSLWVRPETYDSLYRLRSRAEAAFDFSGIEAGRFYTGADGNRVVYVGKVDGGRMERVFIWNREEPEDMIIRAKSLVRFDGEDARAKLIVSDVRIYRGDGDGWGFEGEAGSLETSVDFGGLAPIGYKRKAASTQALAKSDHPADVAEFQWRVTRPLSALLLGFLALRVAGFAATIRRRLLSVILVVTVCVVYNLLTLTARSWVKDGAIGPMPGLFWVDGGLLLYLASPLLFRQTKRRRS